MSYQAMEKKDCDLKEIGEMQKGVVIDLRN